MNGGREQAVLVLPRRVLQLLLLQLDEAALGAADDTGKRKTT